MSAQASSGLGENNPNNTFNCTNDFTQIGSMKNEMVGINPQNNIDKDLEYINDNPSIAHNDREYLQFMPYHRTQPPNSYFQIKGMGKGSD